MENQRQFDAALYDEVVHHVPLTPVDREWDWEWDREWDREWDWEWDREWARIWDGGRDDDECG